MAVKRAATVPPQEGRIVVYFELDRRDNRELFDHLICFSKGPKRCSQLRFLACEGLYAINRVPTNAAAQAQSQAVPSARLHAQSQSASLGDEATERFSADGIFAEPLLAETPAHLRHNGRRP